MRLLRHSNRCIAYCPPHIPRNNNCILRNHLHRERRAGRKRREHIAHTHKYITNLSSKPLSDIEVKVLSKGLTYVPSTPFNRQNLDSALHKFKRSNRLKCFFKDAPDSEPHPFRAKSAWEPPPANPAIEAYLQRIEAEIKTLPLLHLHKNLPKEERIALNSLARDSSRVIENADKGSGIVVEDTHRYITDGLTHLADGTLYEKIDHDPTIQLTEAINKHMQTLHTKGIIDTITRDYITFKRGTVPRTQQLYFLKKKPNSSETNCKWLRWTN